MPILLRDSASRVTAIFGRTRFWAERGIIHTENIDDGGYGTVSIKDMIDRVTAINDMLAGVTRGTTDYKHIERVMMHDIPRVHDFVERMVVILRQAQQQGDPGTKDAWTVAKAALPTSAGWTPSRRGKNGRSWEVNHPKVYVEPRRNMKTAL